MSAEVTEEAQPALRVARGATWLATQGIVVNAISLAFFAFATRLLPTTADFGRFTTLGIFILLMIAIGGLGLPSAGPRFISRYTGLRQEKQAGGVYKALVLLGTGLSLATLFGTLVASRALSLILLGSYDYEFLMELVAVDIFFQLLTLFPISALIGVYRFRESAIVNILSNIV